MADHSTKGNGILRWFSKPWVGLLGVIFSILSVIIAISIYFSTRKVPLLTYYVHPIKTTVLRSGHASALRVLHRNQQIKSDVTAAQVAIWNRGKKPILAGEILNQVSIVTRPKVPIIEATIRNKSRSAVEFSLDTSLLGDGIVPVSWKVLEHNDGAVVQLIYAGSLTTDIRVEGILIGQREIHKLEFSGQIKSPSEQLAKLKNDSLTSGITFVFLFLVMGSFYGYLKSAHEPLLENKFTWVFVIVLTLAMLGVGMYELYGYINFPEPPFGF